MKRATFIAVGLVLFALASLPVIRASAQQTVVTDDNLNQMIASAKTPADHEAIAAYYEQQAADDKKKATLHREVAATYRKLNIAKPVYMANMCDNIAAMWEKAAGDTENLAKAHQAMAKAAG
jgi:hypothetical protein